MTHVTFDLCQVRKKIQGKSAGTFTCTNLRYDKNKWASVITIPLRSYGLPTWRQCERTCLPMQETYEMQVQFMDWEDPLEEGIAIHSNILAWRIPWTDTVHRVVKSWTRLKRLMHAEIFQVFEGIATLEVIQKFHTCGRFRQNLYPSFSFFQHYHFL